MYQFIAALMERGVSHENALRVLNAHIAEWRRHITVFLLEGPGSNNDTMWRNVYSSGLGALFWEIWTDMGGADDLVSPFVAHVNRLLAEADPQESD